jgi:integrase
MARSQYVKVITSSELTEQINPENKKLWQKFLKEKDIKCSSETIKAYESDLKIFFTWNLLYNDNVYFPEIKKIQLADFFNFGRFELKWENARFGRIRSCISAFSDFFIKFYDEEYPTYKNVVKSVIDSLPKVPSRKKTVLTEEQVNSLFDYIENKLNKPQEALLLATAISSGMRISELVQMTTDLIDENNIVFDGVFLETTGEMRTKGLGKQGHRITKFLIKDMFLPYYKKWLPIREQYLKDKSITHNALFIKKDGTPADKQTFRIWMGKWQKFLGIDLYFHAFRHYHVTSLSRLQISNDFIIEIMGWKSGESMIKIYNDLSAKDKKWKDTEKLSQYLSKKQSENDEDTP